MEYPYYVFFIWYKNWKQNKGLQIQRIQYLDVGLYIRLVDKGKEEDGVVLIALHRFKKLLGWLSER